MTVQATPRISLGVEETVAIDGAGSVKFTLSSFDLSGLTLTASSTPPVTKVSADSYTLSSGSLTIDLTALAGTAGTVDGTGLKVQGMIIKNRAGNGVLTIATGGTNGYAILGSSGTAKVYAHASRDGYLCTFNPEGLGDIGASAKTIDVTGTGSEVFDAIFLMG